ncbi:MAG: hypothetical protein UMU76_08060 [Prosthecochloris sp.]|nr:hypothetical protein [Prosthecochloris sp.]
MMYALPSEYSQYDIHRDRIPPAIRQIAQIKLAYMGRELHQKLTDVSIVSDVVALPLGRDWKYKSAEAGVNLIVAGSFRSKYRAIVAMAEVLEDFFVESMYLPRIFPIKRKEWEEQINLDTGLFRAIRMKGITEYSEHLLFG